MIKDNSVIFKGRKDRIIILLDEKADFDKIKEALSSKITDAKSFFGNAKTAVTFKGRKLNEIEENELLQIISEGSSLDVNISTGDDGENVVSDDIKDDEDIKNGEDVGEEPVFTISATDNMTNFHNGSLRSGQAIQYAGSVVLIGDVNPGAEIIAEGNIIVMGSIKGLVHAGCSGNTECYVFALNMQPTQLRISDVITYIPPEMAKKDRNKINPVLAYVQDGQIYIEPIG